MMAETGAKRPDSIRYSVVLAGARPRGRHRDLAQPDASRPSFLRNGHEADRAETAGSSFAFRQALVARGASDVRQHPAASARPARLFREGLSKHECLDPAVS